MREFHVHFEIWTALPKNEMKFMQNSYSGVCIALRTESPIIQTKNVIFADTKIIAKYGYRLFIHPQIGEPFEITLGKCANTSREIKPETNILKLLLSGEFNTDDCKVVEEVF